MIRKNSSKCLQRRTKKMDLQLKVRHNQKHQIYRQVSFTLQESIPISCHHQFQEFCPLSALLILPMGLFPFHKIRPSLLNAMTVNPFHTNHMTTFLCHVTTSFGHHVISFLQPTVQNSIACSRLSVSEDDRKRERATSGISSERDPGEKRRGRESL